MTKLLMKWVWSNTNLCKYLRMTTSSQLRSPKVRNLKYSTLVPADMCPLSATTLQTSAWTSNKIYLTTLKTLQTSSWILYWKTKPASKSKLKMENVTVSKLISTCSRVSTWLTSCPSRTSATWTTWIRTTSAVICWATGTRLLVSTICALILVSSGTLSTYYVKLWSLSFYSRLSRRPLYSKERLKTN